MNLQHLDSKEWNRICQELVQGNHTTEEEKQAMREHAAMLSDSNALEAQIKALTEELGQLKARKLKLSGAMEYVLDKAVRLRHAQKAKADAAATVEPEVKGAQPAPET
jgi:predicted  nucleic acid-binding Zn-ribbon protein